jgi:hypothetical protein
MHLYCRDFGNITGEDGPDGFTITSVENMAANSENGEFWTITSYENPLKASPEQTIINEDQHFELILKTSGGGIA